MNFLCDQCKQKYHVADEKVRGRAVTRFRCKKCNHVIELRMAGGSDLVGGGEPSGGVEVSSASILPPSNPPPAPTRAGAAVLPTSGSATSSKLGGATAGAAPRPLTGTGLPIAPGARAGAGAPAPSIARSGPGAATSSPSPATGGGALPTRPGGAQAAAPATAARPAPRPATGTGLPVANVAPRAPTGTGLSTSAARAASAGSASPLRSGLSSSSPSGAKSTDSSSPAARGGSSASALLNATETGWYAGVRDLPVGPLTRSELAAKIESGDITSESLVWREGLDDWRPLRAVEELSDLVRAAAQRMSEGLLGTMGQKKPAASPQPAGKVVPIAQSRGAAVRPGFESPESDDEPPASDDEPTRLTALADLVAKAEQAGMLTKPASQTARAPSRPAPPPAAPPAPAPAPRPASVTADPLPLVMPSAPASASQPVVAPASSRQPQPPTVAPAPAPAVTAAAALAAPTPAATASSSPAAPSAPAARAGSPAFAGPNESTMNLDAATVGTAGAAMLAASKPATASAAPVVATPATSTTTPRDEAPQRKPGGLPLGAWIMMAGIGFTGVAVGLLLRPASPTPTAPTATVRANTSAPTAPPGVPPRTAGAEIALPNEPATPDPPAAPSAATAPGTTAGEAPGTHRASSPGGGTRTTPSVATAGGAPVPRITAAQQAALRALEATSGVPSSTGPTNSQLANAPQTSAPTGLSGSARAEQVLNALQRSGVVGSCWNQVIRRNPAHQPENFSVELDVQPTGRATRISVNGASDADLANCIQTRGRAQPFGPGGQVTTRASFNLTAGN